MEIKLFDKSNIDLINAEIIDVLNEHFKDKGVSFERGNCKFTAHESTLPVTYSVGDKEEANKRKFLKYAGFYGLTEAEYRAKFVHAGKTFRLTGFNPKAKKYIVHGENAEGTTYCFPEHVLETIKITEQ